MLLSLKEVLTMIAWRIGATLMFLATFPVSGQWTSRDTDEARRARAAAAQDNQIVMKRHVYDTLLARGNERGAGGAAAQLGLAYEQRSDYVNAATWWQIAYAKGTAEGLTRFLNLVISGKITVNNPESIRPLIEGRAFCGSQMARAYLLDHFHETAAQLPDSVGQHIIDCSPASPDDRMDQSLMIQARRRKSQQAAAEYYRLHPDQDPQVKEREAAEGAAILLGALVIQAASMPATGPGSIACNKFQNGYPGATDPSVCNATPSK